MDPEHRAQIWTALLGLALVVCPRAHAQSPDLERLMIDLRAKDDAVRRKAAQDVARVGPSALPTLREALHSEDHFAVNGAAEALVLLGATAVPLLS
jgi:HEAT repeat protein